MVKVYGTTKMADYIIGDSGINAGELFSASLWEKVSGYVLAQVPFEFLRGFKSFKELLAVPQADRHDKELAFDWQLLREALPKGVRETDIFFLACEPKPITVALHSNSSEDSYTSEQIIISRSSKVYLFSVVWELTHNEFVDDDIQKRGYKATAVRLEKLNQRRLGSLLSGTVGLVLVNQFGEHFLTNMHAALKATYEHQQKLAGEMLRLEEKVGGLITRMDIAM